MIGNIHVYECRCRFKLTLLEKGMETFFVNTSNGNFIVKSVSTLLNENVAMETSLVMGTLVRNWKISSQHF